MPQLKPQWCEDHRASYLGACPFCGAGLEPVRFMEARADFAGVPLAGTHDVLPHYQVVDISDVVAVLGQQLLAVEQLELRALEPYARAKQVVYAEMRRIGLPPATAQRAVRVYLGVPGSERLAADPHVAAMVEVLRRGVDHGG